MTAAEAQHNVNEKVVETFERFLETLKDMDVRLKRLEEAKRPD